MMDLKKTAGHWSVASICARQEALRMQGNLPTPVSDMMQGYMERGKVWEHYALEELQERFPGEEIEQQREIEWPCGTLKGDFFIPSLGLAIEHKSRTKVEVKESDWIQLAGQVEFDEECKAGELWVTSPVNPRDNLRLPYAHTVARAKKVWEIAKAIEKRDEKLPDRICAVPADGKKHMCRQTAVCFKEITYENAEDIGEGSLPLDEETRSLVKEYQKIKGKINGAKSSVSGLEKGEKELKNQIAERLEPGIMYVDGSLTIKTSEVSGREIVDKKALIGSGLLTEDQLKPFVKEGKGHSRISIDDPTAGEPENLF